MRNIRVDFKKNEIIVAQKIAHRVSDPFTEEGRKIIELKTAFPELRVVIHSIKKNSSQEHYKGLTYDYMEEYILNHTPEDRKKDAYAEYQHMRDISACHSASRRYPVIKSWFLEHYPEVSEFGIYAKKDETPMHRNNVITEIEESQTRMN